jgi:multiple sugar transport system ATP-binding protein
MVFQNYALYPHMTVADNMAFSLMLAGRSKAEIDKRVGVAAEILGLSKLLDRYPRQLSGGQRQRVAMGRAIVRDPAAFLFDEPLSNLDAQLRVQMRTEIKTLHQRLGCTIVYVTHDQIEAMTLADRIVVMNEGRIVQAGPPLDLYDRPGAKFVAGFLGSPAMNFIRGWVAGDGRVKTTRGIDLLAHQLADGETGRLVDVGIRPEHFRIEHRPGALPITVDVLEPTGSETHVYGRLGEAPVRCVFRDRITAAPGTVLPVVVEPRQTHVFDAVTGLPLKGL